MRLFILGATGKTGTALVELGLAREHVVTTFGRSPYPKSGDSVRDITGNPMKSGDLAAALRGHDVVLCVIGSRGLGATSVRADAARALVDALPLAGVRRLIMISSALLDAHPGWLVRFLSRTLLRHNAADQRAMEAVVAGSAADWTVVRPPVLTNGPLTKRYTVSAGSEPEGHRGMKISRNDVAHSMLDIAESGAHVRQIVWLRGEKQH